MIAKVLLYCNENIGKCTRSTRSHDAPLNQSENAPLQRRASKKMIFYSTLSGLPTNFISFYTTASRCPRSSYTGYLGRSKALCLQGNWFCAPITHKKRNAPPHICLCILFFGMLFTRMSQTGVCQYYVYLSIRELQNCSDMQLPSPGQLTLFFKEHLSNPLFACSWDSR